MNPCMACMVNAYIYITQIFHVTTSGQHTDSQYNNLWESPLPAIFCLLMGLADWHFTAESNQVACAVGSNSNGFGLYLLQLAFVLSVLAVSKPGPTVYCDWQVSRIHFLHQRESVRESQCDRFLLSSLAQHRSAPLRIVSRCRVFAQTRAEQQKTVQPYTVSSRITLQSL